KMLALLEALAGDGPASEISALGKDLLLAGLLLRLPLRPGLRFQLLLEEVLADKELAVGAGLVAGPALGHVLAEFVKMLALVWHLGVVIRSIARAVADDLVQGVGSPQGGDTGLAGTWHGADELLADLPDHVRIITAVEVKGQKEIVSIGKVGVGDLAGLGLVEGAVQGSDDDLLLPPADQGGKEVRKG